MKACAAGCLVIILAEGDDRHSAALAPTVSMNFWSWQPSPLTNGILSPACRICTQSGPPWPYMPPQKKRLARRSPGSPTMLARKSWSSLPMPWKIVDRAALGLEGLFHLRGEAFAVSRSCCRGWRSCSSFSSSCRNLADHGALLVVAAANAEGVGEALLGVRGIGRAGGDLDDLARRYKGARREWCSRC